MVEISQEQHSCEIKVILYDQDWICWRLSQINWRLRDSRSGLLQLKELQI